MAVHREVEPVPGPEAFEETGRSAVMSQAAFVLGTGTAVGGRADLVPEQQAMGMPALEPLERRRRMTVSRAVSRLDLDVAEHVERPDLRLPPKDAAAPLARDLVDHPEPVRAAALVEASLHSPYRLVRTAAAAAAMDTTGPRPDLVDRLVEGSRKGDALTRDLARTALAQVDRDHEALRYVVGRPAELTNRAEPSNTAVVTHGTFASRTTWWRPGGDYYEYLDGLEPPLHLHDPSFRWSGLYLHAARDQAAGHLRDWVADQELAVPDLFAHSHGATVGNLATTRGLELDRLVWLSWPVHGEWLPDFGKVERVIDIRVRFDLVILVDRGGQSVGEPAASRVESHVNGWFDHGDTHDPGYWDRHGLPEVL